jgi:hypothetical protein
MQARRYLPFAVVFAVAVSAGCGDAVSGITTVEWSINRQRQPFQCTALSVASIQIHVVSDTGLDVGTFVQPCELFGISLYLGRGGYSATAVLVDANGKPRTPRAIIPPFRISGNESLHSSLDFPTSVFF